MIVALVIVGCCFVVFAVWILGALIKTKVEAEELRLSLDDAILVVASQRELLLEPCLYKAITHRYNNIRGGDRFQCMKIKEKLQELRNAQ